MRRAGRVIGAVDGQTRGDGRGSARRRLQRSQRRLAAQSTPTPPPAAAGGNTSIAHVEVGSGPQAGTYDATGPKIDCNTAKDGSGATYQDLTKTDGLSGLTFISGEGGATPAKIYFQAYFGEVSASQPILEISTLDPATAKGKATAQLEDKGATIKWTLDGSTADGVTIKATIECGPVDRR